MKSFIAVLLLLSNVSFAQNDPIPHVQGEVLVMIDDNANIEEVIARNRLFNNTLTGIHTKRSVSPPVKIWLLGFDVSAVTHNQMLEQLMKDSHVLLAQNNHFVEERITPNDPNFANQWHHIDPQDNDIDSDLAWNITTGGVTALGDTIVVCVIESGGADWDHPDLIDNHWFNVHEIPGDMIDNDLNGYVDDVHGWNEPNSNDNIFGGSHGTQVSGMIGATGNNNYEVTGINWNVKIMQVQMGSIGTGSNPNEANVIAAYTYPLIMRQEYTSSGGTKGAFVVATNASWGIDAADPNNAPLWCAFYDTLGVNGILNCGATTNSNLDVDAVGDLPTACGSDYMVSVARTDANDGHAGGYGLTTVDLGAPGISVVTTSNGGGSGSTTGTSFASPLTAGVIALLYSAPCNTLAAMANANPQGAADIVRQALLDGTDPVPALSGMCVTGGRLNAFNSLNEIINNCGPGSCFDPWALAASNVTDTQADITWNGAGNSYNIRIREVGAGTWDLYTSPVNSFNITTLTACTDYEVQIQSVCSTATDTSAFTTSLAFSTDGCCEAPDSISAAGITDSQADLSWPSVLAAIDYNVRYKETSSATWIDLNGVSSPYNLTGLAPCSTYEMQVQTVCAGSVTTAFSNSTEFSTFGCGACKDMTYCAAGGDEADFEWIDTIKVGNFVNGSGGNFGYGDFSGMTIPVFLDSTYSITLKPGYSGGSFAEYWKIWIDWDQNGVFDPGIAEEVFNIGTAQVGIVTTSITVPATAVTGVTRMRVMMKYQTGTFACDDGYDFGETEDYCLHVMDSTGLGIGTPESFDFTLYPNPVDHIFTLVTDQTGVKQLSLLNALGQTVLTTQISGQTVVDVSGFEAGMYFVRVADKSGKFVVKRIVIR